MREISGEEWDESCDVIIIGSGLAGLAAAIEARNAGADVIVIEKMKIIGGNTRISDGALSAPGNFLQKEKGVEDSVELFSEDLLRAGSRMNNPELVRVFAEGAAGALDWLRDDLGVCFLDRLDRFGGHSAARTVTTKRHCGAEIINCQKRRLDQLGVNIRTGCRLEQFISDEGGRIAGIEVGVGYDFHGKRSMRLRRLRAERGVVLATGGFGADVHFRNFFQPNYGASLGTTNHQGATAEALIAALRLGALPLHLSWIQLGPWACAEERGFGKASRFASYAVFPAGIVVDPRTGRRIVNEWGDRRERTEAMLRTGVPCLGIVDTSGAALDLKSLEAAQGKGRIGEFDSVEEIAEAYSVPKHALVETIKRYNADAQAGRTDMFGKDLARGAVALEKPPYYVLRLWPKVHYTSGGVAISEHCRVIDLEGNPIKGLYAAGEVCGGIHGASRLGGCALTECIVFGRIAGKNVAELISSQ